MSVRLASLRPGSTERRHRVSVRESGADEVAAAAKRAGADHASRACAIQTIRFVVSMRHDEVDAGCRKFEFDGLAEVSLRAVDLLVAGSGDMFVLAGAYRRWLDEFVAELPNALDLVPIWRHRRRAWADDPDEGTSWLRGVCREAPVGLSLLARENLIVLAVEQGVPEALGDALVVRSPTRGGIAAPGQTDPELASMVIEALLQLAARPEIRARAVCELLHCVTNPLLVPELARQLPDSMLSLPWVERELLDRVNPVLFESAGSIETARSAGVSEGDRRGWVPSHMETFLDGNDWLVGRMNGLRSAVDGGQGGDTGSTAVEPSEP